MRESKSKTNDFQDILPSEFRDRLSFAEATLLLGALSGTSYARDNDAANDPANSEGPLEANGWGSEREIRAQLIRWLCVDQEAVKRVDPHGLRAHSARIVGGLDLSFSTIPFPLGLIRCRFTSDCDLRYIRIPYLELHGSLARSVNAEGAIVTAGFFLNRGFSAEGQVRLIEARIGGGLYCDGASFKNPEGPALIADGAEIKGNFVLRNGFCAVGQVRMVRTYIRGSLDCEGANFKCPGGEALNAEGAVINGYVSLSGISTDGGVIFRRAKIGLNFNCEGAVLKNTNGNALNAANAEIKGSMFLRNGFSAVAEVHLPGARIEDQLQTFGWQNLQDNTRLNLREATVGAIRDEEASWPLKGNLKLDGFVYGRILSPSPTDAFTRLKWLDRQSEFTPQPYLQLAKVLHELGDDIGSKQVLFELASQTRAANREHINAAPLRWFRLAGDYLSKTTVGYGIYPGRALWWLCAMVVVGWIIYLQAQRFGAMAPSDKDAYSEFHKNGHEPVFYPPFSPFVYSLENCVPLVRFGVDDHWQVDPNPLPKALPHPGATRGFGRIVAARDWLLDAVVPNWVTSPFALRWFQWLTIALGWFLTTFFVGAVTGIIKSAR